MISDIGSNRKHNLQLRMVTAMELVRLLLSQIQEIEVDAQTTPNEKLLQMEKIGSEISLVRVEIDSIKKEITLIRDYNVN